MMRDIWTEQMKTQTTFADTNEERAYHSCISVVFRRQRCGHRSRREGAGVSHPKHLARKAMDGDTLFRI